MKYYYYKPLNLFYKVYADETVLCYFPEIKSWAKSSFKYDTIIAAPFIFKLLYERDFK